MRTSEDTQVHRSSPTQVHATGTPIAITHSRAPSHAPPASTCSQSLRTTSEVKSGAAAACPLNAGVTANTTPQPAARYHAHANFLLASTNATRETIALAS